VRGQHLPGGKCRLRSSAGESTQNQEQGCHIFIVAEMLSLNLPLDEAMATDPVRALRYE